MREIPKPTIHQLKVSLTGSNPLIWRRIEVPSRMTLPQLHLALQIAMGWENCHLHEFRIEDKIFGEPDPGDDHFGRVSLDERRVQLSKLPASVGSSFEYVYDFGDNWHHEILIESIALAVPRKRYPVCLAGKESAPPEDVGGIFGYQRYLEALFDPKHENHQEMLAWRGRFDPAYFPITTVNKALREAFPVRARSGRKSAAVALPEKSDSSARFAEDLDLILRTAIRHGRLPPQKLIRG